MEPPDSIPPDTTTAVPGDMEPVAGERLRRHRVLVVEDDAVTRLKLVRILEAWGFATVAEADGAAAWERFQAQPVSLVVTDWEMPGLDGLELCRRIRSRQAGGDYAYLIVLTGHGHGLVEGMEAGADDFIAKPFSLDELRVRLMAGVRVVELKAALAERVAALEAALAHVRRLEGLLPICSYCKKIREGEGGSQAAWQPIESYVTQRSDASFSHSICPACMKEHVEPMLDEERRRRGED